MITYRRSLLLAVLCATAACRASEAPASAGFLYHQFGLTLEPGRRTEALGPLWATEETWPEGVVPAGTDPWDATPPVTQVARNFTLAPLFSWTSDAKTERVSWDLVYPIITYDRYGSEYRFQVFQLLSFSGGATQAGAQGRGFSLIPFFWYRRSAEDPSLNYTAVWPFYGTMQQRLFRDEIKFVVWPFYAQTRKRDVVTDNYLVPFGHVRHGDGLRGWQIWPFYGTEHKDLTTRTDGFGDTQTVPGHDKRFVLWPFYLRNDMEIGSTNPVTQRVLFPFYSLQRSPQKDRDTYLWPFGVTIVDDRELKYHQTSVLWPIITLAHGEGKQAVKIWPFYGDTHFANAHNVLALWPLYFKRDSLRGPLEESATRIAFFVYTDITRKNRDTGQVSRRSDFWPLFITRRDMDGNERFQLLAPIEPVLSDNTSINRLYSPLWSIWRSAKNAKTGAVSRSFLWNLYRYDATPQSKKCSLLFGLIQYHSNPGGKRWRFLYLPSGKRPAPEPTQTR